MPNQSSFTAPSSWSEEMRQTFHTLPAYVQESVMQSGVQLTNTSQLEQCAKEMTKGSR